MTATPDLDTLVAEMSQRLTPDAEERARLERTVEDLLERARTVAAELGAAGVPDFEPMLVGSAAKGTWLAHGVDIDLFLMFAPDVPRAELEEAGLRAGKEILPDWTLRYAEHPYVHGRFNGYDADVVPAYAVPDAAAIQSAVDRTPFHNAHVLRALKQRPALRAEIRLLKAWLQGIGVYGAETATGGVSGYLTEVLALEHGGFLPALRAFADCTPGTRVDPTGGSSARFPDDVLVVIDPVDPGRNAASAVRRDRLSRLSEGARAFLAAPDRRFFDPVALTLPGPDDARRVLGDHAAAVVTFATPDMREDARVPHLVRAAQSLGKVLQREGFTVVRTEAGLTGDERQGWLFLETAEPRLPEVRLHAGPPPEVGSRAAEFRAKYADDPRVVQPVHEAEVGGRMRLVVALRVAVRDLVPRIEAALGRGVALGKHVDKALAASRTVRTVEDAVGDDGALASSLAEVLSPVPPWARMGDPRSDYPARSASSSGSVGRSG